MSASNLRTLAMTRKLLFACISTGQPSGKPCLHRHTNDGQGMNMEEKFDVIPFGEFPLELVTRSLQYMGEDSSSSEEQVSNRIAKTVEILRDASLDGQAFKYIITSDMYDYGLVTVTKDKYILGWCAKGVVWT
eukprot:m.177561 g.177561  ORF g.177561 m.177561 type:complete len:133 (-) comp16574_c0_seq1:1871-2269(-)